MATSRTTAEGTFLAAARAGDQAAFAGLAEAYRAELQLHCYRFLGSLQDAEDLVQETLLRAWDKRATYQGRSTFRAWLYGIATNACLDALRRRSRRLLPPDVAPAADPRLGLERPLDIDWLEPFPDRLLDEAAANHDEPEARLLARETTALAFMAAIQHLPPRQRAVLIVRDVLDWSARETAAVLDTTVAAVNSALQRAHATLARHLPSRDEPPLAAQPPDAAEHALVQGLVEAWERGDAAGIAALLREDARLVMPPRPTWFDGRQAIATFFAEHAFGPDFGRLPRAIPTAANRQPALAVYVQRAAPWISPEAAASRHPRPSASDAEERLREPFALVVLDIQQSAIAQLTVFRLPDLFRTWALPARV